MKGKLSASSVHCGQIIHQTNGTHLKGQTSGFQKDMEIIQILIWLVVPIHLKNTSQIKSFPQVGMKINTIWNHHLVTLSSKILQSYLQFVGVKGPWTPKTPSFRRFSCGSKRLTHNVFGRLGLVNLGCGPTFQLQWQVTTRMTWHF